MDVIRHYFYHYFSWLARILNYPEYLERDFILQLSKKAKGKKILDAGAGDCKYRSLFKDSEYKAQDVCDKTDDFSYSHIDIKSEIYDIPLPNESFDYILCTQVLEHLKYPNKAIGEMGRLLKKGGELWVGVPSAGAEHQVPHDYFRYTRYALRMFAEENGLEVKKLLPTGGRFMYFAITLKNLIPCWTQNYKFYVILSLIQLPFILPPVLLLYLLDKLDKQPTLTCGFLVVFKKSV